MPAMLEALLPDAILPRLLLALAIVLLVGRALAPLLQRLGQPPVIAEMLAGILLGPSLIGPQWSAVILPPAAAPYLGFAAQLGLVLYIFCVGLELNGGVLREALRKTFAVAQAGIALPLLLGFGLALWLHGALAPAVDRLAFAAFFGVALSVTAFPVLARILSDRGLAATPLGHLALGAAAAVDLTAWCLLALVVGFAAAGVGDALRTIGGAAAYLGLMLLLGRPLLRRIAARWSERPDDPGSVAVILALLLLSAAATEAIGIHALFGALLAGVLIPHDGRLAQSLAPRLQSVVTPLLLPAFFAYTGMRTRFDLIEGAQAWGIALLIIVVATAGKAGGTWLAARLAGIERGTAGALAILMNTRGLMELIVLNIGLELGILSPAVYSMLVLMTLVTTMATGPLLAWWMARERMAEAPGGAPPGRRSAGSL